MNEFIKSICLAATLIGQAIPAYATNYEGVDVGSEFHFAAHHFRWNADSNNNGIMDVNEVSQSKNGGQSWSAITTALYKHTIKWRRLRNYQEQTSYIYKTTETRDLKLYVTYPSNWKASDNRPVIVWFYGGAWNSGTPMHLQPQADYFASRGLVNICVDYQVRQRDGNIDPDGRATKDAKSAMRWVRSNASILGIDPNKVIAGGASAGGHLALATHIDGLNDPRDDTSVRADADAFILQNPYVVFGPSDPASAWPVIDDSMPPMWIAYGTNDDSAYEINNHNSNSYDGKNYIAACQAAGVKMTTYIVNGKGHGFCSSKAYLAPSTTSTDNFLQSIGMLESGSATLPATRFQIMEKNLEASILAGNATLNVPENGEQ